MSHVRFRHRRHPDGRRGVRSNRLMQFISTMAIGAFIKPILLGSYCFLGTTPTSIGVPQRLHSFATRHPDGRRGGKAFFNVVHHVQDMSQTPKVKVRSDSERRGLGPTYDANGHLRVLPDPEHWEILDTPIGKVAVQTPVTSPSPLCTHVTQRCKIYNTPVSPDGTGGQCLPSCAGHV